MNHDHRTSSNRNLSRNLLMSGKIAPTKRIVRFAVHIVIYSLLLFTGSAFGQTNFDSYLADAVNAQSAGDIFAAIFFYQKALAIRRAVPQVWANLGLMQYQVGDHAGALSSFKTAYQLKPKLSIPLLFLNIEKIPII